MSFSGVFSPFSIFTIFLVLQHMVSHVNSIKFLLEGVSKVTMISQFLEINFHTQVVLPSNRKYGLEVR